MLTEIIITNTKTGIVTVIDTNNFHPIDLNSICDFYENHKDYVLRRV